MQEIARVQQTMTILCDPRRKRNPTKFRTISFKVKRSNAILHNHLSSSLSSSWSSLIINILININQHKQLQLVQTLSTIKPYNTISYIHIYIYIYIYIYISYQLYSKPMKLQWSPNCQLVSTSSGPAAVTRLQQGATNEQLQLVVSKELPKVTGQGPRDKNISDISHWIGLLGKIWTGNHGEFTI